MPEVLANSPVLRYEALDLMNVRQRLLFSTLKMIFKIKHEMVPEHISNRVMTNNNIHNGDFRLPLYRKSRTQRMLLYEGLMCFNKLPEDFKKETNFKSFCNVLKKWCKKNLT